MAVPRSTCCPNRPRHIAVASEPIDSTVATVASSASAGSAQASRSSPSAVAVALACCCVVGGSFLCQRRGGCRYVSDFAEHGNHISIYQTHLLVVLCLEDILVFNTTMLSCIGARGVCAPTTHAEILQKALSIDSQTLVVRVHDASHLHISRAWQSA